MAVAAVTPMRFGRAEQSQQARFPRLVALILDTIFVSLVTLVATNVYGVTEVTWGSPNPASGTAFYGTQSSIPWIWTTAIWIGYYFVCEALFSATPGKALNGLRVVSVDGTRLTLRSVFLRNLLRIVDALPIMYLLGGILVLTAAQSQRLGDRIARTTVVFRHHAIEPGTARSSSRRAGLVFIAALLALLVFTAGFDYFARPALVIQRDYNLHQLINRDIVSYSLGQPSRTLTTVTYPISARTPTDSCTGSVTLDWTGLFGWQMTGGQLNCVPNLNSARDVATVAAHPGRIFRAP